MGAQGGDTAHGYGVREVEKLLGLARSTIRAMVEAGFVTPRRGARGAWLFSFQDLIVLRTARALSRAKVPRQRVTRALRALRKRLPETMPLSGLAVCAEGDRVVVREGGRRWQADSGQYLLAFEGDPAQGRLSVIERQEARPAARAQEWFGRGLALEGRDARAALAAYEQAIAAAPGWLDAHLNRGALLHEAGRLAEAERAYREGLAHCASAPELMYNLGVLLDDAGRKEEALEAYRAALRARPDLADCHYNLALLCQELGLHREAVRAMAQYRRLRRGGFD
jgi:tetratricopeptide (TPR) repeat protein